MLMVCKNTGCTVDVAEHAVERFLAAGYVPITSPKREPEPEPQPQAEQPKRTRRKPKTE